MFPSPMGSCYSEIRLEEGGAGAVVLSGQPVYLPLARALGFVGMGVIFVR